MRRKKIIVIYKGDDWKKSVPLESAPETRISFEDWHRRGLKHGVEMFRASIQWYDSEKNVFKKAWAFRDEKWIKVHTPTKPDVLFDKVMGKRNYELFDWKIAVSRQVRIFNHPLFRTSVDSKLAQYLLFADFMPKTFLATDSTALRQAINRVSTRKVVLKPIHGSGGEGIFIGTKKQARRLRIQPPILVQEFIKSTHGIPGFSKKSEVADLRMIYMNHKFVYALSRVAKKGSLFTNFHQGAHAVIVPQGAIPKSARALTRKIIKKLSFFPEVNYSLDFIFTNTGKPLLVEMNTTPGFDLLQIVGNEKIKEKNFVEFLSAIQ